ncbi:hypothetical protein J6590_034732 [Homalodisca vitripennis]|nr:hypothetical protein J6590_034732 [Homalodisca vitripennis]
MIARIALAVKDELTLIMRKKRISTYTDICEGTTKRPSFLVAHPNDIATTTIDSGYLDRVWLALTTEKPLSKHCPPCLNSSNEVGPRVL